MAAQTFDLRMLSIECKDIGMIKILHPVCPIMAIQTSGPEFPLVGFNKGSIIFGVAGDAG